MSRPREATAAREWVEAAAARVLDRDPAAIRARLEIQRGLLERFAATIPRWEGTFDEGEHVELCDRLAKLEGVVQVWRGIEAALETTRPLIEAAELALRNAGR